MEIILAERNEVILSTDGEDALEDEDGPSEDARKKIQIYCKLRNVPRQLTSDLRPSDPSHVDLTKNDPYFRLLLTTLGFWATDTESSDPDSPWVYPPSELPSSIEPLLSALKENLAFPPTDLGEMKTLVRRVYKRRAASDSDDSDADSDGSAAGVRPKRKRRRRGSDEPRPPKRKAQEVQSYKSAAFIWDSDEDEEADAAFFAREAALRAEMGRHGQEAEEEIRAIMEGKRRPRPNPTSPSATPAADHAMDVDDEADEEVDEETLQKRAEWKALRKAIMAEWLEHDDDEWRPSDHQEWTGPYTEADEEEFLFRKAGNWDSDAEGPIDPINSDSDSEDEAPRAPTRAPTSRASTAPRRAHSTAEPDSDAEDDGAGGKEKDATASGSEGDKENRPPPMRAKLAALAEAADVPMKNVEDDPAPVARRRRVVESDDED